MLEGERSYALESCRAEHRDLLFNLGSETCVATAHLKTIH